MISPSAFLWLAILFPLVWGIAIYNSLVRLRQHCREAWAGIETELKRRHELIPNLVEAVRGYAAHERQLFDQVVQARSRAVAPHASPREQAHDENLLIGLLRRVFALSESYPELKASQSFLSLQAELANTEDRIQAARRFYNANVRDLNTRIEVFPSNLVAGLFAFGREDFFEVEESSVRLPPAVGLGQRSGL
jgi:LemA protein